MDFDQPIRKVMHSLNFDNEQIENVICKLKAEYLIVSKGKVMEEYRETELFADQLDHESKEWGYYNGKRLLLRSLFGKELFERKEE